jgi:ribose transport system permease protein
MAVTILGWVILAHTTSGLAIYAVEGNSEAARILGINIERTKIIAYTCFDI